MIRPRHFFFLFIMLTVFWDVVAEPIRLNIRGNVLAAPCTLDNGNSTLNVNLGDVKVTHLSAVGATSSPVPVQLTLKDCPIGTRLVTLTFSGAEDAEANGRYENISDGANVAIEMREAGTDILKGPTSTMIMPVQADNTVTYLLNGRVYAKGKTVPGTILATVQATFTYQ